MDPNAPQAPDSLPTTPAPPPDMESSEEVWVLSVAIPPPRPLPSDLRLDAPELDEP
jgi:hypothetical protein